MKNKKMLVRWLSLLLIVIAVIGIMVVSAAEPTPKATGLVLEDMPMVLPANATDVEKTAAKELQHYLKEMTGTNSSIITESVPVENAIYLGATKFAAENNVAYTDNNGMGEGWAIKAVGDNLVVTGGVQRGTLYGVYHLLEDVFGVHWWNMWEEYVPELDSAVVAYDIDLSGEPVFADRGIYSNESLSTLYYVRNRLNGWTSNAPQAFGGEEDFTLPYHVHTFNRYYPAFYSAPTGHGVWAEWTELLNPDGVDWFLEHPDWFAWSDARGERISYGQMCMSNEELVADFTDKILKTIALSYREADKAGVDRPSYISITPNDLGGLCECAECKASTAAHGPSGHLLVFVNKIAEGVKEVYPEIKVETLAYWQYFEVPLDDTVPADNVVIRLASSDTNTLRDLDHWTNEAPLNRLKAWGERLQPGQLWLWNYGVNYSENGVFPNMFNFGPDMQKYDQAGSYGVFYELQRVNTTDFWDLKHWVLSRLMEDPYQDTHELIKTFTYGYYGEAAGQDIYEYLVYMDAQYDDCDRAYDFSREFIEAPWLTAAEVKTGLSYFDNAVAKTEADDTLSDAERELYLNRIAAARAGLDRQILANYNKYVQELAAANDPDQLLGVSQREIGLRMVKAYQWLIRMELEDDYTGIQNPGKRANLGGDITSKYSQYVGETDQATGELLDRPAIPEQIFIDHPGISEAHIYDYTNSTFWDASYHFGNVWIGDSNEASYEGGTSVMVDHGVYVRERGTPSPYYTFSETKAFTASFGPEWYLGDPILNDGQWHLYRAEDVFALRTGSDRLTFWDESLRFGLTDMDHMADDLVDIYVSMKVTGDPSGEDPNNYAKVWVDRVIIVEDCSVHDVNYTGSIPATCTTNEIMTGMCPICGKEARKEVGGTKLNHTFAGDYVYDAETNSYTNTCSVCGEVVYDDFYAELPEEVLASLKAEGTPMDKVHDFAVRDFGNGGSPNCQLMEDADSPLGNTYMYDVNKMGSLGHWIIDDSRGIYTWGNKIPASEVPKASDITTDGEYHIYKMEGVDLFADGSSKIYLFDWSFQLDVFDLSYLKGKTVDMFLSFKVEGDLNYDTPGQMPKYYIDRIIIVENCPDHMADTYTYDAANKVYVGICRSCGLEITSTYPLSLLEDIAAGETNAAHIRDFGASIFNLSSVSVEEDAGAHNGQAVYIPDGFGGGDIVFGFVAGGEFLRFKAADLAANDGKGYQYYKVDDVVVPTLASGNLGYMWSFGWRVQLRNLQAEFNSRMGQTLDIYLSMKVDGAAVSIDRFILVDNCGNHIDPDADVKLSSATCYQGEIHQITCTVCTEVSEMEIMETRLPHNWSEFTYNAETGNMEAACLNDGCGETKSYASDMLPSEVQDRLTELNLGLDHVRIYEADALVPGGTHFEVTNDVDAYKGKAAFCDSNLLGNPNAIHIAQDVNFSFGTTWFKIPVAEMSANSGKGYKIYAFEDLVVPNDVASAPYLWAFNWHLQNRSVMSLLRELEGKEIDVYVSMKVTGRFDWGEPYGAYWIDRMIFVDRCENYDIDYKAPEDTTCADTNVIYTGYCPVCKKEFTKIGGSTGSHSFTKYVVEAYDKTKFTAECDFGCGATDTKIVETQNWRDLLPEELPDSVKNHVIQAYRVPDIYMSGVEESVRLDLDTGRAVGVREYNPNLSSATQYALNTASGISCCLYRAGAPLTIAGTFSGSEIMANANSGEYHLYAIKNVIPIVYESYNYMFMFSDWVMQSQMFDDDLLIRGYRNKALDIYLYMKVDGDPSCASPDKPTYYVDQVIVAESCQIDETWSVTKEATCTEQGEMIGNCAICGLQGAVVPTPMLPHTIVNGYISQQPTCKSNALEYGTCTVCGKFVEQEVPNSNLQHAYSNYVKQDDGVTEIAYCDNGCGERHVRNAVSTGSNLDLPENIQQILPVIGKPASHGVSFSDIKSSDWYFDAVKEAVDNKLINGVTATEFRPNETLTVAQAVKLASAYHERYNTGEVSLTNGAGNWYSSYVDYAVENGIIDSKYASYTPAKMNKAIDRSEFVSIFAKAMDAAELVGYNKVSDNAIPDVKMDDANAEAIYSFYRAGILTGSDGKGTFNPNSSIKRSEVAAILSRMFDSNVRQSITLN